MPNKTTISIRVSNASYHVLAESYLVLAQLQYKALESTWLNILTLDSKYKILCKIGILYFHSSKRHLVSTMELNRFVDETFYPSIICPRPGTSIIEQVLRKQKRGIMIKLVTNNTVKNNHTCRGWIHIISLNLYILSSLKMASKQSQVSKFLHLKKKNVGTVYKKWGLSFKCLISLKIHLHSLDW